MEWSPRLPDPDQSVLSFPGKVSKTKILCLSPITEIKVLIECLGLYVLWWVLTANPVLGEEKSCLGGDPIPFCSSWHLVTAPGLYKTKEGKSAQEHNAYPIVAWTSCLMLWWLLFLSAESLVLSFTHSTNIHGLRMLGAQKCRLRFSSQDFVVAKDPWVHET